MPIARMPTSLLPEIRRLLLAAKPEAQKLVLDNFTCRGPGSGQGNGANVQYGCYQVFGNLRLTFTPPEGAKDPAAPKAYHRELDLNEAIARVTFEQDGIQFQRELLVSRPDQIMALRLTANQPGALSFQIALDRPERAQIQASAEGQLLLRGQLPSGTDDHGMNFAGRVRVIPTGGKLTSDSGKTLRVDKADEVLILFSAATDFKGFAGRNTADPGLASQQDLDKAAGKSWAQLRAAHVAEYQRLFGRVSLQLDDEQASSRAAAAKPIPRRLVALKQGGADPALMALYFQYGRYLLISSSRPGGLPANLQGLWAEEVQTPWNGDYHLDINVQMNYWPPKSATCRNCTSRCSSSSNRSRNRARGPPRLTTMLEAGSRTSSAIRGATPPQANMPLGAQPSADRPGSASTCGNITPTPPIARIWPGPIQSCVGRPYSTWIC